MNRADLLDFVDLILFSGTLFGTIALGLTIFGVILAWCDSWAQRRASLTESLIAGWVKSEGGRVLDLRPAGTLEWLAHRWSSEQMACRAVVEVRPGEAWGCWIRIGGLLGLSTNNIRVRWDVSPQNSPGPGEVGDGVDRLSRLRLHRPLGCRTWTYALPRCLASPL